MKTSDTTIRFRSRPDERRLYEQAAGQERITLSAWLRKVCRGAATGQTTDAETRRDLVRMRMAVNRLAAVTAAPEAASTIEEIRTLLDRRIGIARR